jgi:hypothetical protein
MKLPQSISVVGGPGLFQFQTPIGAIDYVAGPIQFDPIEGDTGTLSRNGLPLSPGSISVYGTETLIFPNGAVYCMADGALTPQLGQIQLAILDPSGPPTVGNPGDLGYGLLSTNTFSASDDGLTSAYGAIYVLIACICILVLKTY